jgi:hypothetical protein
MRMVCWRALLPALTRSLPLERLVGLLAKPRAVARRPPQEEFAVRAAGRLWRDAEGPCLGRSLALYRELGRLGVDVRIIGGVASGRDMIVGHAWVVVDRKALLESTDPAETYSSLLAFDSAGLCVR